MSARVKILSLPLNERTDFEIVKKQSEYNILVTWYSAQYQ
jgi:hypothetical protein